MSTPVIVIITVLATCAVVVPLMYWRARHARLRANQDVVRTMRAIADERTESQAILASLNVGIAAYGSDDRLIATNPMAHEFLGVIPDTLGGFLERFGTDNGMRAAFHLASDTVSGDLSLNGRSLRMILQHRPFPNDQARLGGHIITIHDFTELVRQEERRKTFVANVSHELKTPLTTMKSYSETLLDWGIEEKSREDIRGDVQRIYDDSCRMEHLISDLLLLSRIDSSGILVDACVLDLNDTVVTVADRLADLADERGVRLRCSTVARPLIFADRSAVERVLTNLIVNALRYTERGGTVDVLVGDVVGDVYVKVKDNGIGIANEHLASIFERFYRVDKTGSRQFGGTGLGLSIALELASMHHGRIEAESELGVGSQFTLFLPSALFFLRKTLVDALHHRQPDDPLTRSAVATLRRWFEEEADGATDESDGLSASAMLEIITKKVDNGNITSP